MSITLFRKIAVDINEYIFGTDHYSYIKSDQEACLYPIDLSFTLKDEKTFYHPKNAAGIPMRVYKSVGAQYNPTRIAAYALAHYNNYQTLNEPQSKEIFMQMADWFVDNPEARYEYHFDWGELKSPWVSCMAQGEAVSVLIRAYRLSREKKYLHKSKQALSLFLLDITKGGLSSLIDDKWHFLEEYPTEEPDHVLNGFLYALIGLAEYLYYQDDNDLISLQESLLSSLVAKIDQWGAANWSYYQIPRPNKGSILINCCTPSYHNLQVSQLKYIRDHFQINDLDSVIEKWEMGLGSVFQRLSAMSCKLKYRFKNKAQR